MTRARTNYQTGTSNDELDFQELYAEYIVPLGNGLKIQAGKINTLIGYEVISSWENANFSRSFMFGLGQAFTTTGVRFTYTFNPLVTAAFGVVNGWDNIDDNNRGKTIEYLVALTPHEKFGVSWYGSYGPEQANRPFGDPTQGGAPREPVRQAVCQWAHLHDQTDGQGYGRAGTLLRQRGEQSAVASNPALKANARWNGLAAYLIHDFDRAMEWTAAGRDFRGCRRVPDLWGHLEQRGRDEYLLCGDQYVAGACCRASRRRRPSGRPPIRSSSSRCRRSSPGPNSGTTSPTKTYSSTAHGPTNNQETLSFEVIYVF